ncbi:MAG TPA: ABC transporter ATP-binding protein [Acidimicrobiales bacterium]|nr:ABC transporter ATP-binding protein [Acidimicrobiales bacterium]
MSLLELKGVSKRFGQVVVAAGVSLQLEAGDAVGIVGPNGAGKTTLFSMIAGDVRVDAGEILFKGRPITRAAVATRCRAGIGRTYQIPQPFEHLSVFENALVAVHQGARVHGREGSDRALDALERTGLINLANRPAGALGLLHRKRLELARALATGPELLLLDEIAGGLTDLEVVELTEVIRGIRAVGVTIVWIEHVVRALLSTVDRLVCLAGGELIADGPPQEVLNSEAVRRVYLGGAIINEAAS